MAARTVFNRILTDAQGTIDKVVQSSQEFLLDGTTLYVSTEHGVWVRRASAAQLSSVLADTLPAFLRQARESLRDTPHDHFSSHLVSDLCTLPCLDRVVAPGHGFALRALDYFEQEFPMARHSWTWVLMPDGTRLLTSIATLPGVSTHDQFQLTLPYSHGFEHCSPAGDCNLSFDLFTPLPSQ